MIFGSYPCCNGTLSLTMPDKSPAYLPETCPHCGQNVWHRLSRVQSTSWTEAEFLEQYDVDLESRTIKAKPGSEAARFEEMNRELGQAVAEGRMTLNEAIARAALQTA